MKIVGVLSALAALREAAAFTASSQAKRASLTSLHMSEGDEEGPILNRYSRYVVGLATAGGVSAFLL